MYIKIRRDSQDLIFFAWPFCDSVKLHSLQHENAMILQCARRGKVGSAASPSPTVYWPNNEENGWLKAWLALQATGTAGSSLSLQVVPMMLIHHGFVETC